MLTKTVSKCPTGIAYFSTSLKTPQKAAGLGRRSAWAPIALLVKSTCLLLVNGGSKTRRQMVYS